MHDLSPGRRALLDALGDTPLDAVGKIRLVDEPPPDPASLAPGEVVVAVRSACVGWVDLVMFSGQYQHVPEPPYTPGLEYAGEVVLVASDVTRVRPGDRVMADGLLTGPRSLGAYRREGGFASYARAPADAMIPLPDALSFDQGACLLGGSVTAYHALAVRADVRPGENVLVLGASGSTGLAAVQLATILGARVIAVGRNEEKLEAARAAGAAELVVLREGGPRLRDAVRAVTGGRGADVVYDPVGGDLSAEGLRACTFGARFVVVGWSSTPFVARGGRDPNTIPTNLVLMKGITVLGSPAAIAAHREPDLARARLARILEWARTGALRPHVGATYPLDSLTDALTAKWHGRHAGNVVVHPR